MGSGLRALNEAATCPVCGGAVRVHSGREGTCSYEPVLLPEIADLIEAAERLCLNELQHIHLGKSSIGCRICDLNEVLAAVKAKGLA